MKKLFVILPLFAVICSSAFAHETQVSIDKSPEAVAHLITLSDNCQINGWVTGYQDQRNDVPVKEKEKYLSSSVASLNMVGFKLKSVNVVSSVDDPGMVFNFTNGKAVIYGCRSSISGF